MTKLCECGCGAIVRRRFLPGHYRKTVGKALKRKNHGYWELYMPDHPQSAKDGYIRQTWIIAEKILGKPLPKGAIPHHVDGNPSNDEHSNIVICQDQAYHMLLHVRQRALKECGDANKRICVVCQIYDDIENMKKWSSSYVHEDCKRKDGLEYYYKNKEKVSQKYYDNKEEILKKRKEHYENNKVRIMAQHKDYLKRKRENLCF